MNSQNDQEANLLNTGESSPSPIAPSSSSSSSPSTNSTESESDTESRDSFGQLTRASMSKQKQDQFEERGADSNETSRSSLDTLTQHPLDSKYQPSEKLIKSSDQHQATIQHHRDSMNQQHQQQSINQEPSYHQASQQKDFEEVKQVELFGISIVALTINGKERLCLAQISNTLLKEFSYNEIHNRRVALGITCVQCTPIQLEMLRRAGAMPSSSRRCGMITRREAERLCRSFLVEEQPPELPENFHFNVAHRVNYGCKGRFIPARYISSRAKCIECFYCGDFFSPNKFIFHSHRQPHASDCNPPDSPNINSWRKHIDLDWNMEHTQEIKYAWEDVKSLFNGGTRRRAPNWSIQNSGSSLEPATLGAANQRCPPTSQKSPNRNAPAGASQLAYEGPFEETTDQLIDVECDDQSKAHNSNNLVQELLIAGEKASNDNNRELVKLRQSSGSGQLHHKLWNPSRSNRANSMIASFKQNPQHQQPVKCQSTQVKRMNSSGLSLSSSVQSGNTKRHCNSSSNSIGTIEKYTNNNNHKQASLMEGTSPFQVTSFSGNASPMNNQLCDFLSSSQPQTTSGMRNANNNRDLHTSNQSGQIMMQTEQEKQQANQHQSATLINPMAGYPATNFIYNQLYSQLMQQQQASQQAALPVPKHLPVPFSVSPPRSHVRNSNNTNNNNTLDAQSALRHHLWSSLIANLQCNASDSIYAAAAAAAAASQQTNLGPAGGVHCSMNASNEIVPDVLLNNPNFQDHQHLGPNLPIKLQRHSQQP